MKNCCHKKMQNKIPLRLLDCSDDESVTKLSDFLTICYKDRAEKGEDFLPDSQDEETTRRRIEGREVWVAEIGHQIAGSFTIAPPRKTGGSWWYRQPGVAEVSQITVNPAFQMQGFFSLLIDSAKQRASEMGSRELAGTVPSQRKWLIKAYMKRGFRIVDYKWSKNSGYGSVIVSKSLNKTCVKSGLFRRLFRKIKYFRRFIKYKLIGTE
jgi:GNAT superfamily N-acetyltransferase